MITDFKNLLIELDAYIKTNGITGKKSNAEGIKCSIFNVEDKDIDGFLVGNCEIKNATFNSIYWGGAYVSNSKFESIVFCDVDFRKGEFYSSTFLNCIFFNCKFIGASIQTSTFENTIFDKCDFTNAIICDNIFNQTLLSKVIQTVDTHLSNNISTLLCKDTGSPQI